MTGDVELGLIARALRRRMRWRQVDVAARAGVHRSTVGLIERGGVSGVSVDVLRRVFEAVGGRVDIRPLWRGAQLDRLLDEEHAQLGAAWKSRLELWTWLVRAEVSFNRYGERGRIDLLAWHPGLRVLLVIEIKTDMVDAQGLLGPLDVKTRLAPLIAAELGWRNAARVVPMLLFKDTSTIRRRVKRVSPLFSEFDLVGRAAVSWLHTPTLEQRPSGLLVFSDLAYDGVVRAKSVGRDRVRVPKPELSVVAGLDDGVPALGVTYR